MPNFTRRKFLKVGAVGLAGATAGCISGSAQSFGKLPKRFPQFLPLSDAIEYRGDALVTEVDIRSLNSSPLTPNFDESGVRFYVAAYDYDGNLLAAEETHSVEPESKDIPDYKLLDQANIDSNSVLRTTIPIPLKNELNRGGAPVTYVLYALPNTGTPYQDATYVGESAPLQIRRDTPVTVPLDEIRGDAHLSNGRFRRVYSSGTYSLSFQWDGGFTNIDLSVLKHVLAMKKPNRTPLAPYHDAIQNPVCKLVSRELGEFTESEAEHVENVRKFAQTIPYFYDKTTSGHMDYPKHVEQTLVDGGGDCEDKAALMMGMLAQEPFNYDHIMVFPPNHVASAVSREDLPSELIPDDPVVFTVDGTDYLYVDSTTKRQFGRMKRGGKDKVQAIYDGERWRRLNAESIVRNSANAIKQLLTRKY